MRSDCTPRPWPPAPPDRWKIMLIDDLWRAVKNKWDLEDEDGENTYCSEYFQDMPLNECMKYIEAGLYRVEE